MVPKTLTEERRTLGALLRRPYEAMLSEVYRRLGEAGFADLRPAHSPVFRHVLPEGSRTVDLAADAGMTKQSMAYLVSDLETMGYVELLPDPLDGRAKRVRLTPRGVEAQEAAAQFSGEIEGLWAAKVGEAEWKVARRVLERLFDLAASSSREPEARSEIIGTRWRDPPTSSFRVPVAAGCTCAGGGEAGPQPENPVVTDHRTPSREGSPAPGRGLRSALGPRTWVRRADQARPVRQDEAQATHETHP